MSRTASVVLCAAATVCALGSGACGRARYDPLFENDYVVSVPEDRLAGPQTLMSPDDLSPGTVGLSLREALIMAGNSTGNDLIRFDPDVFPVTAPATIVLTAALPTLKDEGSTLDGRGADVVLDASAVTTPVLVIEAPQATVRQLTIVGSGSTAIEARGADGLTLADLRVENAGGDAVRIEMAADVILDGLTILDPAGRALAMAFTDGARIGNPHIERATGDLISVTDSANVSIRDGFMVIGDKTAFRGIHLERVSQSHICDNIIDPGSARLINLLDSSDNVIERNILDRGHAGVVLEGVSLRNMVFQNVVIGSEYDGVYVGAEASGSVVVHNTLHRCSTPIVDGAADTTLGNNLVADEGFVDPDTYDFRLIDGSPHIDAGEDLGYDCVPGQSTRFLGLAPDLGAVETR